ncbi:MAG: hypothetical protein ACE5E0_03270 [Terriglobia bacterium]
MAKENKKKSGQRATSTKKQRAEKTAGDQKDRDAEQKVEEELGRVSVQDALVQTMITFTSLGYQKMGLPEGTNEKFRDFDEARLAIDCLQALINGAEKSLPASEVEPFKSTLAHLQIQFVAQQKNG